MVDVRAKISSLIIAGFAGNNEAELEDIFIAMLKNGLGGAILFGYNIGTPEELKNLITKIKSYGRDNLLIAVDQEGGKVSRLKEAKGYKEFFSAKEVSVKYSPDEAEIYYSKMAEMLANFGFNLNFAPVVDLDDEHCAIIHGYGRAYSTDPKTVSSYAGSFINALSSYKIMSCLKHFPGHGFARDDSHDGLTDVTNYANSELELIPYYDLVYKAPVIMTAHVVNKNYDPLYPVTLSKHYIQPILREKIKFPGIVIADDLMMKAVLDDYDLKEAFIKAIIAGVNMVIISLFQSSTLEASGLTEPLYLDSIIDELEAEYAINQEFMSGVDDSYILVQKCIGNFL